MNNLAGLPPRGLKEPKPKPNPKYLARVRELPCCICEAFGLMQIGPSYSHHVFSDRFGSDKTPDICAIPLCYAHHQGQFGIHADKSSWEQEFGKDYDYTLPTQDKLGV
jgi:hypothetical protein